MSIKSELIHSLDLDDFFNQVQSSVRSPKNNYNLGIFFVSDKFLKDKSFMEYIGSLNIGVLGTSSREEIFDYRLYKNSLAAILLELDPTSFSLNRFQGSNSIALGKEVAKWAYSVYSDPAVVIIIGGGGFTVRSETLLTGLFSVNTDLPVFGGIASMLEDLSTSYAFDNRGIFDDGLVCLCLDRSKIDIKGMAVSGWKELGTPKRISKSDGNTVYEIEGIPATKFYEKYFQVSTGRQDDLLAVMEYPLLVTLPDHSKVMRCPIRLNPGSQAIIYAGEIPQGSEVRFCSPNIAEAIEGAVSEIQSFRDSNELGSSDLILLFDCAIRSQSFGNYMDKEIEFISKLWDAPVCGFSSWGEIGSRFGETCGLHNTTISLVSFKDKRKAPSKGNYLFTEDSVRYELNDFEDSSNMEEMKKHLQSLRKQKSMLTHFLHLNSEDLDRANNNLAIERQKSEKLLLNILPEQIADRLKHGETKIADQFDNVSVLFADLVGFTNLSDKLSASEIVRLLNLLFRNFDYYCEKYGVEKIKTIGDAYMAAAGLPEPCDDHLIRVIRLAKAMNKCMDLINEKENTSLQIRIGIHSGSVVAGVIGKNKFIYDLWGDTVNVASRMESHGIPGRIHLSDASALLLDGKYSLESRGDMEIKGKGKMKTWILNH